MCTYLLKNHGRKIDMIRRLAALMSASQQHRAYKNKELRPMKRKRKPGGGRKRLGPFEGKRATLTHRLPVKMRKELEASAKKHKHSLSQEAQFHLQQSLLRDRHPRGDIVALTEAIAIAIREVERITDVKWRDSAFTTAAVRRAVDSLLCHFGAPGTPKVPPAIKKHADYA